MITKLGTLFARWCLQSSIYIAVFYNSDLMLDVCGPFTLSPDNMRPLLVVILLIEIFRIFFHLILTNLFKVPWLAKLFPGFKQICTLLLHLFIMTYT